MSSGKMDEVRSTNFQKDEFKALPDLVKEELEKHRQLYLTNPEAAHYWDPIVIGTPGGPVQTLLLHHTGRKSGRELNTALEYYRFKGKIAIVASRGGTEENPAWYMNLLANPNCRIQVGKNGSTAVARTVSAEERPEWWAHVTSKQAAQIEYQSRTNRQIPVVVLELPEGVVL